MYRFPDTDYERSFYRQLFGVETLHEEPERDVDSADHQDTETSRIEIVAVARVGARTHGCVPSHAKIEPWPSTCVPPRSSTTFAR
jgi:hypothetical protein